MFLLSISSAKYLSEILEFTIVSENKKSETSISLIFKFLISIDDARPSPDRSIKDNKDKSSLGILPIKNNLSLSILMVCFFFPAITNPSTPLSKKCNFPLNVSPYRNCNFEN